MGFFDTLGLSSAGVTSMASGWESSKLHSEGKKSIKILERSGEFIWRSFALVVRSDKEICSTFIHGNVFYNFVLGSRW